MKNRSASQFLAIHKPINLDTTMFSFVFISKNRIF